MTMDGNTFYDKFTHFSDTSCLETTPPETLLHRTYILRLLHFIRDIRIDVCIHKLHDMGLRIGAYDISTTQALLSHKVTTMQIEDWFVMLRFVYIESVQSLFEVLKTAYTDNLEVSPLWNLKEVFEENGIITSENDTLLVHIFLLLYNREIEKDKALYYILSETYGSNAYDIVLRILGQVNINTLSVHIETDLCIILSEIQILNSDVLIQEMQQLRHYTETEDIVSTKEQNCRVSLLKIISTRKTSNTAQVTRSENSEALYFVSDIGLSLESWKVLSSGQKLVLVLVFSMMHVCPEVRFNTIKNVFQINVPNNLKGFVYPQQKLVPVTKIVCIILKKVAGDIAFADNDIANIIHKFEEDCFDGVYGSTQQSVMSISCKLQLYTIAYVQKNIQAKIYESISTNHNMMIPPNSGSEIKLPTTIPRVLSSNFDAWVSRNTFHENIFRMTFLPLIN